MAKKTRVKGYLTKVRKPSDLRYVKGIVYTDVFKYLPRERVYIRFAQRRFLIAIFLSPNTRFFTIPKASGHSMRFLFSIGSEFGSFASHLRNRLANVAEESFKSCSVRHCNVDGREEMVSFCSDPLPLSTYSFFKNSFFRLDDSSCLVRCLPEIIPSDFFTCETLAYMLMDTGSVFVGRDELGVEQHFAEIRIVLPWRDLIAFMKFLWDFWALETRFRPIGNPRSFLRGQQEFAVTFWSPYNYFWDLVWPHILPTFRFLFKLVLSKRLN